MRRNNTIILGVTAMVAIGTVLYLNKLKKERKTLRKQRYEVAEEGYETAFDILYPETKKRYRYSTR